MRSRYRHFDPRTRSALTASCSPIACVNFPPDTGGKMGNWRWEDDPIKNDDSEKCRSKPADP